jgi:hypothetical protein
MSDRAKKKERQRLKREKKKLAVRRAQSVSPYKRIGAAGEVEACYINSNWQDGGLATVQLIRRNPQGGHALAVFLIDLWCAGLKDAWGRLDLMQEELDGHLDRAQEQVELTRIDVDLARQLVAGAIRFARQNGFKLPARYDRWTNLLGGKIEPGTADLSRFGKDGKLRWVGPLDDLRDRLIACTAEEFLQRPDVEFLAEVNPDEFGFKHDFEDEAEDAGDADDADDEDEDDVEDDQYAEGAHKMLAQATGHLSETMHEVIEPRIRRKLEEKGIAPPELLSDAVMLIIVKDMVGDTRNVETANLTPLQIAKIDSGLELLYERGIRLDSLSQPLLDTAKRVLEVWDEAIDYDEVDKLIVARLSFNMPRLRKQVVSTLHPAPQIPGGD